MSRMPNKERSHTGPLASGFSTGAQPMLAAASGWRGFSLGAFDPDALHNRKRVGECRKIRVVRDKREGHDICADQSNAPRQVMKWPGLFPLIRKPGIDPLPSRSKTVRINLAFDRRLGGWGTDGFNEVFQVTIEQCVGLS